MKYIVMLSVLGLAGLWPGRANANDTTRIIIELVKIKVVSSDSDSLTVRGIGTTNRAFPHPIRIRLEKNLTRVSRCIERAPGAVTLIGDGHINKRKNRVALVRATCSPHLHPIQIFVQTDARTIKTNPLSRTGTDVAWQHASGNQIHLLHRWYSGTKPQKIEGDNYIRFELSKRDSKNAKTIQLINAGGNPVYEARCINKSLCTCPADDICTLDYRIPYSIFPDRQSVSAKANPAAGPGTGMMPGNYKLVVSYSNGARRVSLLGVRKEAHEIN